MNWTENDPTGPVRVMNRKQPGVEQAIMPNIKAARSIWIRGDFFEPMPQAEYDAEMAKMHAERAAKSS